MANRTIPKRGDTAVFISDKPDGYFTKGKEYRVRNYDHPYVYCIDDKGMEKGRRFSYFEIKYPVTYAAVQFTKKNEIVSHYGPFTSSEEVENWVQVRGFDRSDIVILTLKHHSA